MGRERHSPLYDPTAAICAFETSVPSAAKVGNPPFVLHMPRHAAPSTNVAFGRRFQRVDATHALKRSAGVSYPSVFRGRSLSCLATALSFA